MKKKLTLLMSVPFLASAQVGNTNYGGGIAGSLIGLGIGLVIILVFFLAIRQLVLWYWKVDKLLAYQQQSIKGLQSLYNNNEEVLRAIEIQTQILMDISQKLDRSNVNQQAD